MKHEAGATCSSQWFFQLNHVRAEGTDDQMRRDDGFGNPVLLGLLKGRASFHFDDSFHSCSKGLKKMAIFVMFDEQTETHDPTMRILITGKFSIKCVAHHEH